jgi:chemotaxis response regulator CheB
MAGPSSSRKRDLPAAERESGSLSRSEEEEPTESTGGSAGSLRSFADFFAAMPADRGAAFVVIPHLAPAHASLLPDLVAQHTRMKVVQAQDDRELRRIVLKKQVNDLCAQLGQPQKYPLELAGASS